jgi:hypothetical protein
LLLLLNLPIAETQLMAARSGLRCVASSEFRPDFSVVGERLVVVGTGGISLLRRRGPELEVDKKRCTSSGSEK